MSLDNPNRFDLFLRSLRDVPNIRIYLSLAVGLVLLGAVLFAVDRIGGWHRDRVVRNSRIAVNQASKELQDAQNQAVVDKADVDVKTQKLKEAVDNALVAVEATDKAKLEVNTALVNLQQVVNANRPVGVTANDIEKRLDQLGVK